MIVEGDVFGGEVNGSFVESPDQETSFTKLPPLPAKQSRQPPLGQDRGHTDQGQTTPKAFW